MRFSFSQKIFLLLALVLLTSSAMAGSCRVLVIVGMEDERAIAEGDGVDVVVGTANAVVLRERLKAVDLSQINSVFSFGVAGGLDPTLKSGDLLVSTQVIAQRTGDDPSLAEESWMGDQNILMAIQLRASKSGIIKIRKGLFLGTDMEARDNPETGNMNLRDITGADIIDNESHIAAQYASEHNLPFVSVRAVSDSVNNALPPAALIALDDDGSPNGTEIAKSIFSHPLQLPALIHTAWQYHKALSALKLFRDDVGFVKLSTCR